MCTIREHETLRNKRKIPEISHIVFDTFGEHGTRLLTLCLTHYPRNAGILGLRPWRPPVGPEATPPHSGRVDWPARAPLLWPPGPQAGSSARRPLSPEGRRASSTRTRPGRGKHMSEDTGRLGTLTTGQTTRAS